VRLTIAGPDGLPKMAVPQCLVGNTIACRADRVLDDKRPWPFDPVPTFSHLSRW